jgi:hypothetical protein
MVTNIVVGMLVGTLIHVRGLARDCPTVSFVMYLADFGVLITLYQLVSRQFHVNVECNSLFGLNRHLPGQAGKDVRTSDNSHV